MEGLSLVCGGLGAYKADIDGGGSYVKGEDCLENLKDLQRYMRRDHPESREVFFELGKWNIVRHDLVPIVLTYRADNELVLNAVKVIVFLTMPVDPTSTNLPLQYEYLRGFKDAFLEQDAIGVIVTQLEKPLEHLESGATTEDDWKLVQLMLTLFRNLLFLGDPPQQTGAAATLLPFFKDELVLRLFRESVMDLLLALVQHMGGGRGFLRHDNLLMVEIFHYIFWTQQPELVAAAAEKEQKQASSSSDMLRALREKEKEERRTRNIQKLSRHARFEGTYTKVGQDGSKSVVSKNPFQSPLESMLRKPQIKRGPVKRIAQDVHKAGTCSTELLVLLKDLADQFLDSGYNILMQAVKEDIRRERSGLQASDYLHFFHVAEFFTSYQHHKFVRIQEEMKINAISEVSTPVKGRRCGPIASTMDEDMFTLVISKWNEYADSAKQTNNWEALHCAGALLKGMIHMLNNVLKTADRKAKEGQQEIRVARILLYKVFYDQTENGILNFLLQLVKSFDIHKQPRRHLTDLVETSHVVLELLEGLTEEDGAMRVLTKARNVGGRKKKQAKAADNEEAQPPENPTDPDDNATGAAAAEESLIECARPARPGAGEDCEQTLDDPDNMGSDKSDRDVGTDDCSMTTSGNVGPTEAEEQQPKVKEVSLDIRKYAGKFADNTVIRNYCWLLSYYKENSIATNQHIVRMLERISNDCVLEPLLYQISLLKIFHVILSDKHVQTAGEHRSLCTFLTKIVRNMFKRIKLQPLLFVELLFWKTRRECHNITADYMLDKLSDGRKSHSKRGHAAYDGLGDDEPDVVPGIKDAGPSKRRRTAMEDALGEDEYDERPAEEAGLPEESPADGFGDDAPGPAPLQKEDANANVKLKRLQRRPKAGPFNEEQEDRIKELFEQFKDKRSCLKLIAEALDSQGSFSAAQIGRKLKQMGIQRTTRTNKAQDTDNDPPPPPRERRRKVLGNRSAEAIRKLASEGDHATDSDDDVPLATIRRKQAPEQTPTSTTRSSTDDDDELPLFRRRTHLKPQDPTTTTQGSGDSDGIHTTTGDGNPAPKPAGSEDGNWSDDDGENVCPSLRPSCGLSARKKRSELGSSTLADAHRETALPDPSSADPDIHQPSAAVGSNISQLTEPPQADPPKRRRLTKKTAATDASDLT